MHDSLLKCEFSAKDKAFVVTHMLPDSSERTLADCLFSTMCNIFVALRKTMHDQGLDASIKFLMEAQLRCVVKIYETRDCEVYQMKGSN